MKRILTALSIITIIGLNTSCKKGNPQQPATSPIKTIRFVLYTNKDFSSDNDTVSFKLVIRNNAGTIQSRTIFDTTLATIRFKDIPGPMHKLIFEKKVPNDGTLMEAGFIYSAWFGVGSRFDTVGVGEKLKVFEYPFQ